MRIAFLTPCVSRLAGGIFEIERRLAQSLTALPETAVEVFGVEDEFTKADAALWAPVPVRTFTYIGPAGMRYSAGLARGFCKNEADVAHLHALWMHTSLVARRWSRRRGKPFVTTLHGMLDPWALANSTWKKRLTGALYERDCLERAACLQVNSEAELRSARAFGLKNPVCIIPNGIDVPVSAPVEPPPWAGRMEAGRKVLLYLGRIHPKKGLVNLLNGWADFLRGQSSAAQEWHLVIAGWDQGGHENELRTQAEELGITDSICFVGPQHGGSKTAAFHHADAFVLPSFSEGLPMAVLEGWSHGKPVLMTPECNLPDGYTTGAAVRITTDQVGVAAGLHQLSRMSASDREDMGQRGRRLVGDHYTWSIVAQQMREVYAWLLGGGDRPSFLVRP